jgi:hypothetical protein
MKALDLGRCTPFPEREEGGIDMLPPGPIEQPEVVARRLLSLLILLALRSRATAIRLRNGGKDGDLAMSVGNRWYEGATPPVHLASRVQGLVWSLGHDERPPARLRGRRDCELVAPDPPWESRFSASLGGESAQVSGVAAAVPDCVELILSLHDVTIPRTSANAKLGDVFPAWHDEDLGEARG